MKQRCLNKNHTAYRYYGQRGIKICDRWLESFDNFLEDMGEAPNNLTLDRINNDGNYEKGNCRWITMDEQFKNKRIHKGPKAARKPFTFTLTKNQIDSFKVAMKNGDLLTKDQFKYFRQYLNLTQQQLADKIGYSSLHISQVELGKRSVGSKLMRALKGLNIDNIKG